ncbi:MAG: thiamine phosphate synthase [Vicinamibacterales bacterium]
MKPELPGTPFLYPIIDTALCRSRQIDPVALCDAYLAGGARVLQLREKERSSGEFLSLAEVLVQHADRAGALLIVNDRADIARLSGAAGVHVGQDDLSVADARKVMAQPAIIGISTHDDRQIDSAIDSNPTYIAVGPVHGTSTKETGYSARGLEFVRRAAARGRPVVAIGGLTLGNVADAVSAGAVGIAVISDMLTGDPEARTRAFIARLAEVTRP